MRRDPTEFRQRFAAWKDGENYWDTRGEDMLPGYSGGKTGFYNTHRDKWKQFLISKGVDAEQANRLSTYFAAQDSLESGGGTSSAARQKNNFGGMQRGGKNISYDTVQDYMNDKWNMMNKRFSRALDAKTVQEYATLINDPKYAGKGYLYAVADGYNQKNPQDRAWVARQIQHMNNYTKAMMGIAGQKGFVARPVPKAPVVSKTEPIEKANPIPSAVELLEQNELPLILPESTITTQTPTQAAQQAQLSEYIQKPLVSEKVPVLGGDYWENYFNNNSLDQFQSLIQQQMTSHKHGKNILPKHKDGKTPGEYNEELVELPEVRVDRTTGDVIQDGRRGSVRLPEVVVNRTDPRNYRSAFNGNQEYLDDIVGFVPIAGDVNDAINAGIAAKNGDYLQAGMLGAGLLLPNVLEKPLKLMTKVGKRGFKNIASAVGVQDYVWDDLEDAGIKKILKAKLSGEYAFTKRGHDKLARNLWRKKISPIAQDVIDTSIALEDIQFKKRMYGKYSDRLDDYPRYIGLPDSDTISPVEYDFKKNLIYDQLGDRKPKYFVQTDPRQIRRAPDIRSRLEDVHTSLLADLPLADRSFSGIYHPDIKRIDIPMHVKAHTGFLNPYLTGDEKGLRFLIGHEYTHHLQNQPNFAQNLALSVFSGKNDNYWTAMPGDYIFGKYQNPFQQVYNRANNRLNEVTASKKLGFGQQVDPELEFGENGYAKYGSHNASPDEAVADLRGFIIAGYSDDEIYRRMAKEYGMTADDVDLAIEMGYKHGKNPIHINPANRGKFNALKKRTGKTTEQLTHSKNLLTRKRAIFALNSRKWRRK